MAEAGTALRDEVMKPADIRSWRGGMQVLGRVLRLAWLTPWQVVIALAATVVAASFQLMLRVLLGRAVDQTQTLLTDTGDADAARGALLTTALLVLGVSIPVMTSLYGVTPLTVLPQMFLLMTLSGAVTPVVMAGAVYHHPEAAGTSAGLSSALGMVIGTSFTVWSGAVFTGDFAPIAGIMGVASGLTFISWLMVRRAASADAKASSRRSR